MLLSVIFINRTQHTQTLSYVEMLWIIFCEIFRTLISFQNAVQRNVTLFRMGIFGAAHGWGGRGQKGPPFLESVTHILQWWNLAQLYFARSKIWLWRHDSCWWRRQQSLSIDSNYIVDVFMSPKFGNSGMSMREVIPT